MTQVWLNGIIFFLDGNSLKIVDRLDGISVFVDGNSLKIADHKFRVSR